MFLALENETVYTHYKIGLRCDKLVRLIVRRMYLRILFALGFFLLVHATCRVTLWAINS